MKDRQETRFGEPVSRIEPTLLDRVPAKVLDVMAEFIARATILGDALHPRTAQQLASLVRVMNAWMSMRAGETCRSKPPPM
jgi:hypothetical protein